MGADNSGENYSNRQQEVGRQTPSKPSLGWRIARATGAASLLASFGIAATGNADNVVYGAKDAVGNVVNFGIEDQQHSATQKVRNELAEKGIKFGDPRDSAIATDPNTGRDGLVWRHGSLGDISISGTVGVKMEMQRLIIRDQASTDGKDVSLEEIKKMGVHLEDLWMLEVHGGPITEEPKEGAWVKFTALDIDGNPKDFFAKEEFAKLDGKNELRLEVHDSLAKNSSETQGK